MIEEVYPYLLTPEQVLGGSMNILNRFKLGTKLMASYILMAAIMIVVAVVK